MRKPDSQVFVDHINRLKSDPVLASRTYWIDFVFHITDIENAANILRSGYLYSRAALERNGLIWEDAASSAVIEQTRQQITEYVRLYFRPKTPTAYHMEGIRPVNRRYSGNAHCPVPVYFAFDIRDILSLPGTSFSDGNLASRSTRILQSSEDFTNLPFHDIYHDRGWGSETEERQNEIKPRRQAEVIVRDALGMESLRAVVCRSQAEYDTLRQLLGNTWEDWKSTVKRESKPRRLFHLDWLFVDTMNLSSTQAQLHFNLPKYQADYGPFDIRVAIREESTGTIYSWEHTFEDIHDELPDMRLRFDLSAIGWQAYTFRLEVDGKLAYLGHFTPDIPF